MFIAQDEIAKGDDGKIAKNHDLHTQTPLWYYILKEAEQRAGAAKGLARSARP